MTRWEFLRGLLFLSLLLCVTLPLQAERGRVYSFGGDTPGEGQDDGDVEKLPPPTQPPTGRGGTSRLESPTTLSPNPNTTLTYGTRHPSWSEQNLKDFFNTLQTAMREGGSWLRNRGWKGVWHRGSRSFSPLKALRVEYRTKSEFSHNEKTNNKDDVLELYFWRYKSPADAQRNLQAVIDGQKDIHKQNNKYATYEFLGVKRLNLADEAYQTAMKASSRSSSGYSKTTRGYYLRRGYWVVVVLDSAYKYESGEAVLTALNYGLRQASVGSLPIAGKKRRDSLNDLLPDTSRARPPKAIDPF